MPLIVVEGPPEAVERATAELRAAGWTIVQGWSSPTAGIARIVCVGPVETPRDAEAALLAALGGSGLVVDARGDRDLIDRFVDDLRRLGDVDHRISRPGADPELDPASRAILALLTEGLTVEEAAGELRLSRRAADRRIATARAVLGTERTTDTIALARRVRWSIPSE